MSNITRSLAWAGVIIGAALVMQSQGMSDPASAGVVLGLAGAAWGNLQADTPCGRGCLQ
ncbi:hypothetical protein [Erythrobacter sp.]|uniref:hypothetical protein n=1 Tax=Erythrobacter sp. TaxID=1042 RepID=UPI001425D254|nr:hypothetical protein [Erythrobacter sp.]QIQ87364.1 MAG: hypothetical protein G9473_12205 [Erythrobacter sp.]